MTPLRILHLEDDPLDAELILSDFALVHFDGIEALALTRALHPEIPFLFVSGAIGEELAIGLLRRGATDYVLKHRLQRLPAAIERARQEQENARQRRRADEGLRFLAEAGVTLMRSLDDEANAAAVAKLSVPWFADWATMDLVDKGAWKRAGLAHVDPMKEAALRELFARYPAHQNPQHPVARAMATLEPVFVPSVGNLASFAAVQDSRHLELMRDVGVHSFLVVPALGRDSCVGTLAWVRGASRPEFDELDLRVACELASRAALAIENARLYRQTRSALQTPRGAPGRRGARPPESTRRHRGQLVPAGQDGRGRRARQTRPPAGRAHQACRRDDDPAHRGSAGARADRRRSFRARADLGGCGSARVGSGRAAPAARGREGPVLSWDVPSAVCIRCDRDRILQALSNLAGNAIKFTPPGGAIQISVATSPAGVRFSVRDNGPGIPVELQERLYERYWQASRGRHGIGLGLSIAKAIVEAHGSALLVDSAPGRGACFHFTLPNMSQPTPAADAGGPLEALPNVA